MGAAVGEVSFPAHVVTASGVVLPGRPALTSSNDTDAPGGSWGARLGLGHAHAVPKLTEGQPPAGPDEVVLDAELARRAGVQVGDDITVQATAAPRTYRVAGVAAPPDADGLASQSALFFSAAEAERLAGHPGGWTRSACWPSQGWTRRPCTSGSPRPWKDRRARPRRRGQRPGGVP